MRKVFVAAVLAFSLAGCCKNLSREGAYHDGVKQYAIESGLLDKYEGYLDADPRLNPQDGDDDATLERKKNSKRIKKATPSEFRLLIAEEEKALDKEE